MKQWRRRGFSLTEVIYALGLATLAAGAEVDGETADRLLYAASAAVQRVAVPVAVLPVLAALRPLGEKAPHRYVSLLAAASELETLDHETVEYIYDALQQLRDRLIEAERRWPLVEATCAYSNLPRKHSGHIEDRLRDVVADMCWLYGEVGERDAAAAPDSGPSAQRPLDAVARANVLAAALYSDVLAPLVREHCGLGDLVEEAGAVRKTLEEAARPDELRKFVKSDADFAEWVTARSATGNAGEVVEGLSAWFKYELALYKLDHAINERGELDAGKLEETAKEFEKVAEILEKLKDWGGYLVARSRALRALVKAPMYSYIIDRLGPDVLQPIYARWYGLFVDYGSYLSTAFEHARTSAVKAGAPLGLTGGFSYASKMMRWLGDFSQEAVARGLKAYYRGEGRGFRELSEMTITGAKVQLFDKAASLLMPRPRRLSEAKTASDEAVAKRLEAEAHEYKLLASVLTRKGGL
jgi:hypothetical protein